MRREAFRGVVWPRQLPSDATEPTVFRYAVVGMLVSDRRLPEFETGATTCLAGSTGGMLADALLELKRLDEPEEKFGDANDVLRRLREIE